MFIKKSTRYRSQLSSITRNIEFINGNVSGEIAFNDITYLAVPRTKSVTFKQRSLVVSGPQLWNSPSNSDLNGEQYGWIHGTS